MDGIQREANRIVHAKCQLEIDGLNVAIKQLQAEIERLRADAECNERAAAYWWMLCLKERGESVPPATDRAVREACEAMDATDAEIEQLTQLLDKVFVDPGPVCENAGVNSSFAYFWSKDWENLKREHMQHIEHRRVRSRA